jgi:hypothetical protein
MDDYIIPVINTVMIFGILCVAFMSRVVLKETRRLEGEIKARKQKKQLAKFSQASNRAVTR